MSFPPWLQRLAASTLQRSTSPTVRAIGAEIDANGAADLTEAAKVAARVVARSEPAQELAELVREQRDREREGR